MTLDTDPQSSADVHRESQPLKQGDRTRKSAVVAATGIALMAASLTSCGFLGSSDSGDDYAAVCIDKATQQRVEDGRCGTNYNSNVMASPFLWYFLGRSATRIPAIGQSVAGLGGTTTKPTSGKIGNGYPREGAAITKNGFGNRAKSGGGSNSNSGGGSKSRSGGGSSGGGRSSGS